MYVCVFDILLCFMVLFVLCLVKQLSSSTHLFNGIIIQIFFWAQALPGPARRARKGWPGPPGQAVGWTGERKHFGRMESFQTVVMSGSIPNQKNEFLTKQ